MRFPSYRCRVVVSFLLACVEVSAASQGRTPDFARSLTINLGLQGRVLWVDATANLEKITNADGVRTIVDNAAKANINVVVLDVKPVSGEVMYASKFAKRLTQWRGRTYPLFDSLAAFVKECRARGIEIYASFNVLSEGHKYFNVGLAYGDKGHWQSTTYVVDRFLAANASQLAIRTLEDPDDPKKTTVYAEGFLVEPSRAAGSTLAVALDSEQRVAGIIDPALLGEEPLAAPEDGNLMVAAGVARDWVSANLIAGRAAGFRSIESLTPVTQAASEKITAFVTPLHPEVRRYEIALMTEVAKNYDVDGIVLDRCRYANVFNDYGELSRQAFEKWIGKRVVNWPQDILQFDSQPGRPFKRGPLFRPWLEFRARVIREFVRDICEQVRSAKPGIKMGAYVGSWFTEYYGVGVNWGSEKFPVKTAWASPAYNEAGYAEFLDWISTGCYYPIAYRSDARLKGNGAGSVEAAAELSSLVVGNSIPAYAGIEVQKFQGNRDEFAKAISVAAAKSHGVMLFDTVYIDQFGYWDVLQQAFSQPAKAPHQQPGLFAQLRAVFDAIRLPLDSKGNGPALPIVPWLPGGG